jgi:tetratricopeptide (TPR) repeat protein
MMRWRVSRVTRMCSTRRRFCWRRPAAPTRRSRSWRRCISDRPQDGAISNALGFILADHNRDLSRAHRLINSALKSEPDNPAILDSLGWLQYRRGMPQAALPLLERAFRLDQDGDIGAHWGEVLWALGDKAKAREIWNRALMADPDNELVKAAQQRVGVPSLTLQGTGTSI